MDSPTDEKKSLWISMGFATTAALVILLGGWYIIDQRPNRLHITNLRAIPTQMPIGQLDEAWLSQEGNLIAVFHDKASIKVNVALPDRQQVRTIDFGQLIDIGRPEKALSSFNAEPTGSPIDPARILRYALSDDGLQLAWAWAGKLYVAPLDDPQHKQIIPHLDPSPVTAISFLEEKQRVVTVHSNGVVTIWDTSVQKDLLGTILRPGDWRLTGRNSMRALFDFRTSNVVLIRETSFTVFPASPTGSVLSTSRDGSVILGTTDGLVLTLQPRDPSFCAILEEVGAITAIASYSEQLMIVSGEQPGLFMIKHGTNVEKLAPAPPGIRRMSVNPNRITYVTSATPEVLVTGDLSWQREFDDQSKWRLALLFSTISLLAFARVITLDAMKLRFLRRKAVHSSSEVSIG